MNKFSLLTISILLSLNLNAQIGSIAPDFTVTDIDGNEISLYADILDQGLIAVVDVSATWCPPCWTLHESKVLQNLHVNYGPDGTNQLRVIYYEGDTATDMEDLLGNTSESMGNWLNDSSYPFVDETTLTLDLDLWAPLGFPTVNVIRPSDKMNVADPYNIFVFNDLVTAINDAIDGEVELEIITDTKDINSSEGISAFPNPTSSVVTLSLQGFANNATIEVFTVLGRRLSSMQASGADTTIDFSIYDAGTYMVKATSGDKQQVTQVNVVR